MDDSCGELSAAETLELRRLYFAQAHEILEELQDVLLRVENDPGGGEELKVLKRLLHTLKGDSNSLGFAPLGTLCHRLEDVTARYAQADGGPRERGLAILFSGLDELRRLLAASESSSCSAVNAEILGTIAGFLEPASRGGRQPERRLTEYQELQLEEATARGLGVFEAQVRLHSECGEPEVAAQLLAERLGRIAEIIFAGRPEDGRLSLLLASRLSVAELREAALAPGLTSEAEVSAWAREAVSPTSSPADPAPTPKTCVTPAIASGTAAGEKSEILRVESGKVDALLELVGELIINRSMLGQAARDLEGGLPPQALTARLLAVNASLERTVSELHKGVMRMRMVPIQRLFRKFPRIVRDLANQQGKRVKLELQGEGTELDKAIVEALGEPLLHIVRNLVDHGIESPLQRRESGKPEEGTVRLRACQEGSSILVEAGDDGRGIDTARLRARAVELGVASAAEAERLSEAEALRLVFVSGLSTAERVSETSGRGVGMDAVKSAVERMKGLVEIDSTPSRGTTFRLRLPITLAVIKALLFECGAQLFAMPVAAIAEVAGVAGDELQTVDGLPTLLLRGRTLSVIRLGELFKAAAGPGRRKFVLVLNRHGRRIGILVDRLLWQQELVIKPIDDRFLATTLVAGGSILGDGTVVFILDDAALLEREIAVEKRKLVNA